MKIKTIVVTNIKWDAPESVDLPNTILVKVNKKIEYLLEDIDNYADELCDYLSDIYEYCIKGFNVEVVEEIQLTRNEKRELKEYLYSKLVNISEYHSGLYPWKKDSLNTLIEKYFYWGDIYNDDYIPEEKREDEKSLYLAQEFKKHLSVPTNYRYYKRRK